MAAVRCVLFDQTFAGPKTPAADTQASLEAAGFKVRKLDVGPYGNDGNDGNAWLVVETAMQAEPSHDEQAALIRRANDAANRFGFVLRLHGVTWGWTGGGA